jgi:hypothetical protein
MAIRDGGGATLHDAAFLRLRGAIRGGATAATRRLRRGAPRWCWRRVCDAV